MKRRQFLKSVFGVAAGLVVAPSVVKGKVKAPMCAMEVQERYKGGHYGQFKQADLDRMDRLRIEAFEKAANPPYIISPNGDIHQMQQYSLGTTKETGFSLSYRKYCYCKSV